MFSAVDSLHLKAKYIRMMMMLVVSKMLMLIGDDVGVGILNLFCNII